MGGYIFIDRDGDEGLRHEMRRARDSRGRYV